MNQWIDAFLKMIDTVLRHPAPGLEQWLAAVLAVVAAMFVLDKTGGAFEARNTGGIRPLLLTLMGLALTLLSMTAVVILWPAGGMWARVGAAVVVSLVIVVPLICVLQKTGYMGALMSWAISVGAAACVILLVTYAFDAFASGSKEAGKTKQHKRDLQQVIGP